MRLILAALAIAGLSGCSGDKSATCSDSSDCPSGNVCLTNRCERLCNDDEPCPGGFVCDVGGVDGSDAGICMDDSGLAPVISSVAGNGTQECVTTTGAACMGTGFVAQGRFTDTTQFSLVGPAEATNQTEYDLTIASLNATGTTVELTAVMSGMPALSPGQYSLVATNQAGVADTNVQLLQGTPGPDLTGAQLIDRINGAAAGQIDASKLDLSGNGGGGGSGGTLYIYDESPTSTSSDTNVGDRMWIRLRPPAGETAGSLAIDHQRFSALCGDGDGCSITLGAEGYLFNGVSRLLRTGGECKFFYNPGTGEWTLDDSCTVWTRALLNNGGTLEDPGDSGPIQGFKPYVPSVPAGFDNGTASDTDGAVAVMGYANLCFLAESPASTASPGLVADSDDGFHLAIAGSDWIGYPAAFFPAGAANRSCVLIIED
ncbi:MAG: hypothetical protein AAF654_14140 [Myxococcota bacterium]